MQKDPLKVFLVTPPMTQINTPYPATAYLKAWIKQLGYQVEQADAGLDLALKLFSKDGLRKLYSLIQHTPHDQISSESVKNFIEQFDLYDSSVEPVIRFLQGKDPSLALRICKGGLLPEGPRFLPLHQHPEILENFGPMGTQDMAKHLASLYLDDLADVYQHACDPHFGFSRYGESLAASQNSFDPLWTALHAKDSLVSLSLLELTKLYLETHNPDVVGFTCPFPGNLFGALKMAQFIKKSAPLVKVVLGGGFVNTELRQLSDFRIYDFVDYICFDDGELPLQRILQQLSGELKDPLVRTFQKESGPIQIASKTENIGFAQIPAPDYSGLRLNDYVSMLEMPNPMHRMWSDFRWNKLILAHGCYWKKCNFCDISLDYIQRFEPKKAEHIVDHMIQIMNQTGSSGFHFVDEAAPPALLKAVSKEILKRKIQVSWWGNLRFDQQFDAELTQLMFDAGCVAVTGGLEVASPRLLKLINKGIDLEQVARVTKSFSEAGIFVHAYLMYGFPTQTAQETIDSLEVVRQLFEQECLHSGFWHRFMATVHSPVGRNPEQFSVEISAVRVPEKGLFAINEIPFFDPTGTDHDLLGVGLKKALYNYMHGMGIDQDVQTWFQGKYRKLKATVPKNQIRDSLI